MTRHDMAPCVYIHVCGYAGGLCDSQRQFSFWHRKIQPRRWGGASKWSSSFSLDPKKTSSCAWFSFPRCPCSIECISLPCLSLGIWPPLLVLSHWAAMTNILIICSTSTLTQSSKYWSSHTHQGEGVRDLLFPLWFFDFFLESHLKNQLHSELV